jgi:uncharacterized protein YcgI (DUF1989 family)
VSAFTAFHATEKTIVYFIWAVLKSVGKHDIFTTPSSFQKNMQTSHPGAQAECLSNSLLRVGKK